MTTIYDASILLVDDNPDLLTLVTDNLRTAGYKSVCTAADCAAARAAFAAHRPDLMILDINLPSARRTAASCKLTVQSPSVSTRLRRSSVR